AAGTDEVVNQAVEIGGKTYTVTCVSVGNPHCVVFCDAIDGIDLSAVGPQFEYAPIFPERVNTEFARVINRNTLRLRVWERGNGETLACGTGACAVAAAAVRNGYCEPGRDIIVKLPGGDLTVNCTPDRITLTGEAVHVFEGTTEL
ncbi:MAG: diaminopimelate epimerase, partial [Clostridia bacterium]|nr:diaminopimelate epimerase [Clostridia bacterium]